MVLKMSNVLLCRTSGKDRKFFPLKISLAFIWSNLSALKVLISFNITPTQCLNVACYKTKNVFLDLRSKRAVFSFATSADTR